MPKLEDHEDFNPAEHTLSESAKQNLFNNSARGSNPVSSVFNPISTGQSTANQGSTIQQYPTTTSTSSGIGTTGSFGSFTGNSFTSTGTGNVNTGTAGGLSEGGTTTIPTTDKFGDFINSRWRPLMAVIYMITCTTDFVIFPILWSILQAMFHGTVTSQWQPLTLQSGGLYHIAMGAVLGLAAYGRSQEKIAGKA